MTRIYFDLETTGLRVEKYQIAQVAAATEAGKEFEVKVRFQEHFAEPAALRLGWYDAAAWTRDAVDVGTALARFDAWLTEVEPSPWRRKLAGHFAAEFDKPFLLAAYAKAGRRFPADFRVLDTMQLAMWLLPGRRSYKLGDLYRDLCGKDVDKTAGAPGDVLAVIEVVKALRGRFGRTADPDPVPGHDPSTESDDGDGPYDARKFLL